MNMWGEIWLFVGLATLISLSVWGLCLYNKNLDQAGVDALKLTEKHS